MGIFNDIGTFITKTIPNVVTKDIPRIVTREIPKVITQDIPRIVTNDIPKAVIKDIPNFITKEIPKVVTQDIPELVTKGIPKAFTEGIPNIVTRDIPNLVTKGVPQAFEDISVYLSEDIKYITDPETYQPGIGALRERVENMEQRIVLSRGSFLELRARYSAARSDYINQTEDYATKFGQEAAKTRITHVQDEDWDDPQNTGEKVLAAVDSSFRFVVNFLSFGATDAAWVANESKQEMDFLEQRESELSAVLMRFAKLNDKLNQAINQYRAEVTKLREELGAEEETLGEALNDERMEQAGKEALLQIATNMLKNGEPVALVATVTGMSIEKLKQLTGKLGTQLHEKGELDPAEAALELIQDSLPNHHIERLTGLSTEALNGLRQSSEASGIQADL